MHPFKQLPFTWWHCSFSKHLPHGSAQLCPKKPPSHSINTLKIISSSSGLMFYSCTYIIKQLHMNVIFTRFIIIAISKKNTFHTYVSFPSSLASMHTATCFSVTQPLDTTVSATILLTVVSI